jgi:two-component system chemotaxis sensor kinase CheA
LEAPGLSRERLIELLLHGGVSTSRSVSHVAGRGVGLDVVRETVAELKGEVDIQTWPGKGTDVQVLVPVSLSLVPALRLESGGIAVYAPLDSVRKTLRVERSEISRSSEGERVRYDDRYIPFADLSRVLRRADSAAQSPVRNAVVIEAGGRLAAVGVEQLRGVRDIIVRTIPLHVAADPTVAGVALDDLGVPRLVLAPAPVVHWIHQSTELPAEPQAPARLPILVIDDSLTTRMLEQSILESAGYDVDLAVCAEDALEMAGRRRYGLFIVDVEMPGMNGFEFIARTKQSAQLRDTPAVLVTSRSDPEDKRRGRDVGARAYVVKSQFNQQDILNVIRGLIG